MSVDNGAERLRPAYVQYGDWQGTAAADAHVTIGHKDVYEVVGLDRSRWWIVAVDITSPDVGSGGFYVYAIDQESYGMTGLDGVQQYARQHGSVPVTSFLVHDISAASLLAESFTDLHIQLRSTALADVAFDVVELDDLNLSENT